MVQPQSDIYAFQTPNDASYNFQPIMQQLTNSARVQARTLLPEIKKIVDEIQNLSKAIASTPVPTDVKTLLGTYVRQAMNAQMEANVVNQLINRPENTPSTMIEELDTLQQVYGWTERLQDAFDQVINAADLILNLQRQLAQGTTGSSFSIPAITISSNSLKGIQEAFNSKIKPILTSMFNQIKQKMQTLLQDMVKKVQNIMGSQAEVWLNDLGNLLVNIKFGMDAVSQSFKQSFQTKITSAQKALTAIKNEAEATVPSVLQKINAGLLNEATSGLKSLLATVQLKLSSMGTKLSTLFGEIKNMLTVTLAQPAQALMTSILGEVRGVKARIVEKIRQHLGQNPHLSEEIELQKLARRIGANDSNTSLLTRDITKAESLYSGLAAEAKEIDTIVQTSMAQHPELQTYLKSTDITALHESLTTKLGNPQSPIQELNSSLDSMQARGIQARNEAMNMLEKLQKTGDVPSEMLKPLQTRLGDLENSLLATTEDIMNLKTLSGSDLQKALDNISGNAQELQRTVNVLEEQQYSLLAQLTPRQQAGVTTSSWPSIEGALPSSSVRSLESTPLLESIIPDVTPRLNSFQPELTSSIESIENIQKEVNELVDRGEVLFGADVDQAVFTKWESAINELKQTSLTSNLLPERLKTVQIQTEEMLEHVTNAQHLTGNEDFASELTTLSDKLKGQSEQLQTTTQKLENIQQAESQLWEDAYQMGITLNDKIDQAENQLQELGNKIQGKGLQNLEQDINQQIEKLNELKAAHTTQMVDLLHEGADIDVIKTQFTEIENKITKQSPEVATLDTSINERLSTLEQNEQLFQRAQQRIQDIDKTWDTLNQQLGAEGFTRTPDMQKLIDDIQSKRLKMQETMKEVNPLEENFVEKLSEFESLEEVHTANVTKLEEAINAVTNPPPGAAVTNATTVSELATTPLGTKIAIVTVTEEVVQAETAVVHDLTSIGTQTTEVVTEAVETAAKEGAKIAEEVTGTIGGALTMFGGPLMVIGIGLSLFSLISSLTTKRDPKVNPQTTDEIWEAIVGRVQDLIEENFDHHDLIQARTTFQKPNQYVSDFHTQVKRMQDRYYTASQKEKQNLARNVVSAITFLDNSYHDAINDLGCTTDTHGQENFRLEHQYAITLPFFAQLATQHLAMLLTAVGLERFPEVKALIPNLAETYLQKLARLHRIYTNFAVQMGNYAVNELVAKEKLWGAFQMETQLDITVFSMVRLWRFFNPNSYRQASITNIPNYHPLIVPTRILSNKDLKEKVKVFGLSKNEDRKAGDTTPSGISQLWPTYYPEMLLQANESWREKIEKFDFSVSNALLSPTKIQAYKGNNLIYDISVPLTFYNTNSTGQYEVEVDSVQNYSLQFPSNQETINTIYGTPKGRTLKYGQITVFDRNDESVYIEHGPIHSRTETKYKENTGNIQYPGYWISGFTAIPAKFDGGRWNFKYDYKQGASDAKKDKGSLEHYCIMFLPQARSEQKSILKLGYFTIINALNFTSIHGRENKEKTILTPSSVANKNNTNEGGRLQYPHDPGYKVIHERHHVGDALQMTADDQTLLYDFTVEASPDLVSGGTLNSDYCKVILRVAQPTGATAPAGGYPIRGDIKQGDTSILPINLKTALNVAPGQVTGNFGVYQELILHESLILHPGDYKLTLQIPKELAVADIEIQGSYVATSGPTEDDLWGNGVQSAQFKNWIMDTNGNITGISFTKGKFKGISNENRDTDYTVHVDGIMRNFTKTNVGARTQEETEMITFSNPISVLESIEVTWRTKGSLEVLKKNREKVLASFVEWKTAWSPSGTVVWGAIFKTIGDVSVTVLVDGKPASGVVNAYSFALKARIITFPDVKPYQSLEIQWKENGTTRTISKIRERASITPVQRSTPDTSFIPATFQSINADRTRVIFKRGKNKGNAVNTQYTVYADNTVISTITTGVFEEVENDILTLAIPNDTRLKIEWRTEGSSEIFSYIHNVPQTFAAEFVRWMKDENQNMIGAIFNKGKNAEVATIAIPGHMSGNVFQTTSYKVYIKNVAGFWVPYNSKVVSTNMSNDESVTFQKIPKDTPVKIEWKTIGSQLQSLEFDPAQQHPAQFVDWIKDARNNIVGALFNKGTQTETTYTVFVDDNEEEYPSTITRTDTKEQLSFPPVRSTQRIEIVWEDLLGNYSQTFIGG
ncbi:hypothetical protein COK81_13470 [Bacillus thuringiensis]|uniref:Crystaline entomocidal protoxin n=2 Tax=Bacillus cereus group TaxID=86661 RepID=A0A9X7B091_BACTU|nr:insecticidal delta-endotoxin Cry8Ea1 family protein [Bacillus thuringiensis]PFT93958.1 hypothetical protein COK81_13470 [Bacillus thuringiensis]